MLAVAVTQASRHSALSVPPLPPKTGWWAVEDEKVGPPAKLGDGQSHSSRFREPHQIGVLGKNHPKNQVAPKREALGGVGN